MRDVSNLVRYCMFVKIEWCEEYEGIQGYIKGFDSWVESIFIFCKSQKNIKFN